MEETFHGDQMSQHFLLSRAAKTLTLAQVMRMTNEEAETMFRKIRWPDTDGRPVCPFCGGTEVYDMIRPGYSPRSDDSRLNLMDDFGKSLTVQIADVSAWQPSDYAAELEGALAITRAKQEATEKFQREMQGKHSLLVPQNAANMRNGGIIAG